MKRPYRLSSTFVQRVREPGRYGDGRGGNGLSLLVKLTKRGDIAKSWAQRLHVDGERRNIGIGAYPIVSLTEARRKCADNAAAIRRGETIVRTVKRTVPTFADAFETALAIQASGWRGSAEKTARSWRNMVGEYAMPKLGPMPVDRITTADVLEVLAPLWQSKRETGRKLRQRVGAVMKWAIAEGHRTEDPTGAALTAVLPKNGKVTAHHKALPFDQVAGAIATVHRSGALRSTVLAFEFLVLTATRSGEVRGARWGEVDLEADTWTVPAARTKTGAEHRVPLSGRALAILREARGLSDGEVVFPTVTGKALSDSTISKLIREQGIPAVPHGFRSSFREWAGARGVDREVAEAALAHSRPGVEAAYHRADLFDRRREVMTAWAAYLESDA